ncbi:MAG: hypothetical protein ABSF95_20930 [Verrucomicrobiota bacterium]
MSCLALTIAALSVSVSVFAAPVPVAGDAPVPGDRLRPGNPAVFPMTATWRFKLEHGTSPALDGLLPVSTNCSRLKIPAIITEQPHIFCVRAAIDYDYGILDFWGNGLLNTWDIIWPADGITGSWIRTGQPRWRRFPSPCSSEQTITEEPI